MNACLPPKFRVLVVDDEPDGAATMRMLLLRFGLVGVDFFR